MLCQHAAVRSSKKQTQIQEAECVEVKLLILLARPSTSCPPLVNYLHSFSNQTSGRLGLGSIGAKGLFLRGGAEGRAIDCVKLFFMKS